jgi:hypothetical protein
MGRTCENCCKKPCKLWYPAVTVLIAKANAGFIHVLALPLACMLLASSVAHSMVENHEVMKF